MADDALREIPRRQPDLLFDVAVDDVVLPPGQMIAAGLAEGDGFPGDVLQLDGHVFEHVAEPGALVLAHAPQEAAGLAIRAAVLGQPRLCCRMRFDEGRPQPPGG